MTVLTLVTAELCDSNPVWTALGFLVLGWFLGVNFELGLCPTQVHMRAPLLVWIPEAAAGPLRNWTAGVRLTVQNSFLLQLHVNSSTWTGPKQSCARLQWLV